MSEYANIRVSSFDVFDTSLVRRVIAPSEVFRILARALPARHGTLTDSAFETDFIAARVEAERRARLHSLREETTLDEIWHELARILPAAQLAGATASLELDIEAGLLGPVQTVLYAIEAARRAGRRIIFASDTYFPASFIEQNLSRHGLFLHGDRLYASSETGLTKRSGRLFSLILQRENLAPSDLEHYGDDHEADVVVPTRLGVRARAFKASQRNRVESILVDRSALPEPTRLALAGTLRFLRLSSPPPDAPAPVRTIVDAFLGPFCCLFGQWILARARVLGLRRLDFAARDARLLQLACARLERDRPTPIDCRYLHVSRRALLLAASGEGRPEELAWIRRGFEQSTLASLAGKLDLPPDRLIDAWNARLGARLSDTGVRVLSTKTDWEDFWALTQGPLAVEIREAIKRRSDSARSYLSTAGLNPDQSVSGFVDLGWFLTCQEAINRLLAGTQGSPAIQGLYLALQTNRRGPAEAGRAEALLPLPAPDLPAGSAGSALYARETLLEHIVGLADHPTVMGYHPNGIPLYATSRTDEARMHFTKVAPVLLDYVDLHGEAWSILAPDSAATREVIGSLIASFFSDPPPSCARWLETLPCSDPRGGDATPDLCSPYGLKEILYGLLPGGACTQPPRRLWPEAALALSSPTARRLLRLSPVARSLWRRLGL